MDLTRCSITLLAGLYLFWTSAPLTADDAQPGGVLSGPVEGMSERRKQLPLPSAQIDPATASPEATPAERPMRPFSGWVDARGCDFQFDGLFLGRLQDGRISGMAGEGVNFDWEVAADGRFGGRLPLKRLASGEQAFQWLSGRVEADRLVLDVEYGVPDRPDLTCSRNGIELVLGR
ncbi:MAG: hypothetical protein JJ899_02510 [Alphaproteobacteria bacterium]|nr:hypothetical protein [Alphaproteobacteria bacterium]